MLRRIPGRNPVSFVVIVLCALVATAALAAEPKASGKTPKAGGKESKAAKVATEPKTAADLPEWTPPAAYSVDLVMNAEDKTFTMKRFIDGKKTRSEITSEGHDIVMIELGDEAGTTVSLMPEQKTAMKMTRRAMSGFAGAADSAGAAGGPTDRPESEIELVGEDEVNGLAARKYRVKNEEGGDVFAWFDKSTNAPLRMEMKVDGKDSSIEWRNYKPGPQPAKLYEVPKGYEVQDMDAMMAKMKSMGGVGGVAGAMGMGMAGGMAQSYAGQMGSQFGASVGEGLGASFGGPLGAMAGRYIGGAVGGWLGKKVAGAVTPGP